MKARSEAVVLTALLFIPDPSPLRDFYGKVGVARLEETYTFLSHDSRSSGCFLPPYPCNFDAESDTTDSRPYLGVGARFKIGRAAAVRVEYEAIDRDVGDNTTMFSVGVAWER